MAWQSLRKRLLSSPSEKSYGPILLSSSPTVAEILAGIGYGHIVIDMEHSPIDVKGVADMLRAINSAPRSTLNHSSPTVPLVRVPSHDDAALTKRVLDILRPPAGIIFPMVENASQAGFAVSSTRYPAHYGNMEGIRGCAHPFVRASAYGANERYYDTTSRDDLLVCIQVETEKAIHNIPEIAKVEGVDCIFIGPFDVSCSVNEMGNFEEGSRAMDLIKLAEKNVRLAAQERKHNIKNNNDVKETGPILGGFRTPGRNLEELFSTKIGYQFLCGTIDVGMIKNAAICDLNAANIAMKTSDL